MRLRPEAAACRPARRSLANRCRWRWRRRRRRGRRRRRRRRRPVWPSPPPQARRRGRGRVQQRPCASASGLLRAVLCWCLPLLSHYASAVTPTPGSVLAPADPDSSSGLSGAAIAAIAASVVMVAGGVFGWSRWYPSSEAARGCPCCRRPPPLYQHWDPAVQGPAPKGVIERRKEERVRAQEANSPGNDLDSSMADTVTTTAAFHFAAPAAAGGAGQGEASPAATPNGPTPLARVERRSGSLTSSHIAREGGRTPPPTPAPDDAPLPDAPMSREDSPPRVPPLAVRRAELLR
eukprot:TRINITY_DN7513_c0_g1_i1.p1 TRINITY_DN7513_c0_g1~~TRINITY_DN7513_c0_g1_i1.p1  ORF type:complete len:292 (+),score=27.46 TRINITY_DN7513_c0_g1_i1:79-954(+)